MKKIRLPGSVLFFMVLMLLPVSEAHAKEVPADGNIPLTAEYFPDEWFLEKVARYDEDKDGILSKEGSHRLRVWDAEEIFRIFRRYSTSQICKT